MIHNLQFADSKMSSMESSPQFLQLMSCYELTEGHYNQQVSDTHLEKLSRSGCKQWKSLPPYLKLETIVAEDIDKSQKGEREKRYDFLLQWKEIEGSSATYRQLIIALLKIKCRQDAEKLCEMLKKPVSKPQLPTATGGASSHQLPVTSTNASSRHELFVTTAGVSSHEAGQLPTDTSSHHAGQPSVATAGASSHDAGQLPVASTDASSHHAAAGQLLVLSHHAGKHLTVDKIAFAWSLLCSPITIGNCML